MPNGVGVSKGRGVVRKLNKVKEQQIQKEIIDYLRLKRYVVFKHHSTGFTVRDGKVSAFKYGERGIADIIACSKEGRFIAIEVKCPGKKATPEQVEFLAKVNARGGIGFIAYSLDDVLNTFEKLALGIAPVV